MYSSLHYMLANRYSMWARVAGRRICYKFRPFGDSPGISGMVRWLDTPIQYFPWYTSVGVKYPGPYGVYPYIPQPYYSDFRLNSLAGMNWDPFQKNWSETMDYAQTKSSFRVYPISSTPSSAIQSPAPTYTTTQPQVVATGRYTSYNSISRHARVSDIPRWQLYRY